MIEKDIRTFLVASSAVNGMVGGRIYAGHAPQGVDGGYVLLRPVSRQHYYSLGGEVTVETPLVQIDCYDESKVRADAVAEAIRNRLSGYQGTAGDTYIQAAVIIRDGVLEVPPTDASDRWTHLRSLDFQIFHTVSAPTLA